jgi:hypothetical protein
MNVEIGTGGHAIPFLGIFVLNFRYCVLTVSLTEKCYNKCKGRERRYQIKEVCNVSGQNKVSKLMLNMVFTIDFHVIFWLSTICVGFKGIGRKGIKPMKQK